MLTAILVLLAILVVVGFAILGKLDRIAENSDPLNVPDFMPGSFDER